MVAGVLVGVLTSASSNALSPAVSAAHITMNSGWFWAALAYLVGLSLQSRGIAALMGSASLIGAVLSYYTLQLSQGKFEIVDFEAAHFETHTYWAGYFSKVIFWCIAACAFGSISGIAGHEARRGHGKFVLIWRTFIPVLAILEAFARLHLEVPSGSLVETVWYTTFLCAVVMIAIMVSREAFFALRSM
ncbi:DUF6518 family protein [Streptomyces sp. IPPR8]|uniref:DUF6518 family protein n=1 Tax=Streptomyces sp. IPPR8 TaxID=3417301 RepID=UPI003D696B27